MALTVHGSVTMEGTRKAKITVEGDNPGEVNSTAAKSLALMSTAHVVHNAGISGQSGAYPVDPATGKAFDPFPRDEDNNPLPPRAAPRNAKYRQDFYVQAGM